jgi:hypothetical protein
MNPILNEFGMEVRKYCECCSPRMTTATSTSHKWTRKEIENEILYISKRVVESGWFSRGNKIRKLKHWVDKLERFNEFN